MRKRRRFFTMISLALIGVLAINLIGCAKARQAENLMANITPNAMAMVDDSAIYDEEVVDFALRLFKTSEESGENILISPLSVVYALAMTANGAEGKTLTQMETVLGVTSEELNRYLCQYMKNLPQNEQCKLHLANSIWFSDDTGFLVNQEFLQRNGDYYGADIYKAPFNNQTCKEINNWVKENTDGMIPEILDQIPKDAVMYLINALAFDGNWVKVYEKNQIKDGEFTREDGKKQDAEFMYGTENAYLEDDKATGFMKYYKGGNYAFVALLPKESVTISEYIATMEGEGIYTLLKNPQYTQVRTSIPKFETEYEVEMSNILMEMGMTDAFDGYYADFDRLGVYDGGNIYISRVLHKTFITLGEQGTKAGAATVVEMQKVTSVKPQKFKEVYLDRPFVYMIVDCENMMPLFIGTMMDVEK